MADRIRIGVVGAHAEHGWARNVHLPALKALEQEYEIAAVASTSLAGAQAAARLWGAADSYDDPAELFARPDLDLVTIAVQLPRRDGLVEAAIAAGKHVYSEWPLALDAPTAARYRDKAAAAGVRSAVGLQSRHHPAIRFLHDLIAEGRLGELLSASLTYTLSTPDSWPQRYAALFDKTKGVNHLAIVGGHSMDLFRYAVGEFTELSATLSTRISRVPIIETGEQAEVTSPDQIVVNGLLDSGAAASVHIVTGGPRGEGYRIEVHGRAGRVVVRSADDSLVGPEFGVFFGSGTGELTALPVPERYFAGLPDAPVAVRNVHQVYTGLARVIREGGSFQPDFDTALSLHRVLDAIRASAESGVRQQLG